MKNLFFGTSISGYPAGYLVSGQTCIRPNPTYEHQKNIRIPVEMKRYQLIELVQQALQHSRLLHMCTQRILP